MAKKKKKKRKKGRPKLERRGIQGRRVAICGKGEGRGLCPRAPYPGVDVWGTNNVALQQPCDMIWDMHDLDWTMEQNIRQYDHLELSEEEKKQRAALRHAGFRKLKEYAIETGIPLMSVKKYILDEVEVPGYSYPLQDIIKYFDSDLFSSVTPYMIAYAIYRALKYGDYYQIDLYGINCHHGEEWAYQREAVSGWLMYAKGAGIKVTVNGGKYRPLRLQMGNLYGYDIPQMERGIRVIDKWKEPPAHMKYDVASLNMDQSEYEEKQFEAWKEA